MMFICVICLVVTREIAARVLLRLIAIERCACLMQGIKEVEYDKVRRFKIGIIEEFLIVRAKLLDESFENDKINQASQPLVN